MIANLRTLPKVERIRLVEDLWDSIATDQVALPMTDEQRAELDQPFGCLRIGRNQGPLESKSIDCVRWY